MEQEIAAYSEMHLYSAWQPNLLPVDAKTL
jgi:hypothetical protein